MARGWESKSVEEQAEQREDAAQADSRRVVSLEVAVRTRELQLLELKRERILSEKTTSPVRRQALVHALQGIEAAIRDLK
jgi:hypothetical protein